MKRITLLALIFIPALAGAQFYEGRHKVGISVGQAFPVGDFKLQKAATVEEVYNRGFSKPGLILGAHYGFLLFKHFEIRGEAAYSMNSVDAELMQSELNTIRPSARWTIDADAWKGLHFLGGFRYKFNITKNQRLKGYAGLGLGVSYITAPFTSIRMVNDTADITAKHKVTSSKISGKVSLGMSYLVGKRWLVSLEGGLLYSPTFFSNGYSQDFYRWTHPASFEVPYALGTFELGVSYTFGKNPFVPLWDSGPQKKKTEQRMKRPGRKQKIRNRKKRGEAGM